MQSGVLRCIGDGHWTSECTVSEQAMTDWTRNGDAVLIQVASLMKFMITLRELRKIPTRGDGVYEPNLLPTR